MGFFDKIKGWLNIGGVKVLLWKYSEPLSKSNPVITGAVLFKSKNDKTVSGLEVLIRQGALSFERWTGEPAPLEAMRVAASAAGTEAEGQIGSGHVSDARSSPRRRRVES